MNSIHHNVIPAPLANSERITAGIQASNCQQRTSGSIGRLRVGNPSAGAVARGQPKRGEMRALIPPSFSWRFGCPHTAARGAYCAVILHRSLRPNGAIRFARVKWAKLVSP